ncbi:MAG: hypothetical protein KA715_08720 [Xanthomonadaceae bacterium]|nr:hypothetical protein [Xanthomonadaceae bacterium]
MFKKNKISKLFFIYSLVFSLSASSQVFRELPEFNQISQFVRGKGFIPHCDGLLIDDPMKKFGPHFFLNSIDPQALPVPDQIRIMIYNFEGLFKLRGDVAKTDEEIDAGVRLIKQHAPHIIGASEVENIQAMGKAAAEWFNQEYFSLSVPDNDEFINLGLFIKRIAFEIEVQSYREVDHLYLGKKVKLFSRDLPVYIFRDKGAGPKSQPRFIFVGTHFKSQRDYRDLVTNQILDRDSAVKRHAQFDYAQEIIEELIKKYPGVPLLFGGDMNMDVEEAQDMSEFEALGFVDTFDLMKYPKNSQQRVTHSFFPGRGGGVYNQMDAIYVDGVTAKSGRVLKAFAAPHVDRNGKPKPLPHTFEERALDASDHRPVIVDIDISVKH